MKTLLAALAVMLCLPAASAQSTVTLEADIPLPLGTTNTVNFYERTGAAAPFTYVLAVSTSVASAGTTGVVSVRAIVTVPSDGLVHTYIARTATGPAPTTPTNAYVSTAESVDSVAVTVQIRPAGNPPTTQRIKSVVLK